MKNEEKIKEAYNSILLPLINKDYLPIVQQMA
jgi:hypothetical protein